MPKFTCSGERAEGDPHGALYDTNASEAPHTHTPPHSGVECLLQISRTPKIPGVIPESFLEKGPLEPQWKSIDSGGKLRFVMGFCGPGQVTLLTLGLSSLIRK